MKDILDNLAREAKLAKVAMYEESQEEWFKRVGEIQRLILELAYEERNIFTDDEDDDTINMDADRLPDDQVIFRTIGGEAVPINKATGEPVGGWKGNPEIKKEIAENKKNASKNNALRHGRIKSLSMHNQHLKTHGQGTDEPKKKKPVRDVKVVKESGEKYSDAGSDRMTADKIHTQGDYGNLTEVAKGIARGSYDKGRAIAKDYSALQAYLGHGYDHICQVAEKSEQASAEIADVLEKSGKYGKIDNRTLYMASLLHDTGMDGDSSDYKGSGDDGSMLRGDHPINSAINVLKHRKELEAEGLNADDIAMTVLAHSKSSSGIGDLSNRGDYQEAIKKISDQVVEYNQANPDNEIKFNYEGIYADEERIKSIGAMALCLRLGDANRDNTAELVSQTGGKIAYDLSRYKSSWDSLADERANHDVTIDGEKINPVSASFALGENNFKETYVTKNDAGDGIREVISLQDGRKYPYSTAMCAIERVGELQTMKGIPRTFEIQLNIKDEKERQRVENIFWKELDRVNSKREKPFDRDITFVIH